MIHPGNIFIVISFIQTSKVGCQSAVNVPFVMGSGTRRLYHPTITADRQRIGFRPETCLRNISEGFSLCDCDEGRGDDDYNFSIL